ncbi:MAG TPA: cytochrome c peroxidase [Planctomycetota bacterium]|nr:cytochrome c peroxidase [Planctomycetota bacterium]
MRTLPVIALLLAARVPAQEPPPSFQNLQQPPLGLPAMPPPPAPASAAAFALGERLFADPILSVDRTVSCRHCHQPEHGFASPEPLPAGVQGKHAVRHAPTLFNRAYGKSQRWDGSTPTLEQFVLQPIQDPNEMGLKLEDALQRLRTDPGYQQAFGKAFQGGVSDQNLSTALSTFVRGITRADAPIDRFQHGQTEAIIREQRAGLWIFESKGSCWRCHTPPLFTDESFHDTGIGVQNGEPEPGRMAFTHAAEDRGRFKTPTLRGVRLTAPYMHDGSLATLEDVVEFYARGGNHNQNLDPRLQPLELTAEDKLNLLAFLRSL